MTIKHKFKNEVLMQEDKLKLTSMIIVIFLALTYFFCGVRDLLVRQDLITYKYIYINGIHIHHYCIGIALLILGLILLLYCHGQKIYYICSAILGIGAGLVLDKAQKATNLRLERFDLIFMFILIVVAIPIGQYLFSKFKNFNFNFKITRKNNSN